MNVYTYEDNDPTRLVACVDGECWAYDPADRAGWPCTPVRPDTTDPATIGWLIAFVREAWGERVVAIPLAQGQQWHVCRERNPGSGLVIGSGTTEWAALESALLAAP